LDIRFRRTLSMILIRVAYDWRLCENMTPSTKPEVHKIPQAAEEGPSHGQRQHAQKIRRNSTVGFLRYACGQTDRQVAHSNIPLPYRSGVLNCTVHGCRRFAGELNYLYKVQSRYCRRETSVQRTAWLVC